MSVTTLIQSLSSHGVLLTVEDGKLKIDAPKGILTPALRELLQRHKADVIAVIDNPVSTSCWRDSCEERAAIMEIENRWSRNESEQWAFRHVLHDYVATYYPTLLHEVQTLTGCGTEALH